MSLAETKLRILIVIPHPDQSSDGNPARPSHSPKSHIPVILFIKPYPVHARDSFLLAR